MSGKRALSVGFILVAATVALLRALGGDYPVAVLWAAIGAAWGYRTLREWNTPAGESRHPLRDQILIGILLLAMFGGTVLLVSSR